MTILLEYINLLNFSGFKVRKVKFGFTEFSQAGVALSALWPSLFCK